MKILISGVVGLLGSWLIVMLDIKFVKWLFTLVPNTDWAGLVKVLIVFVDIWFTAGLCILPFLLGIAIGTVYWCRDAR